MSSREESPSPDVVPSDEPTGRSAPDDASSDQPRRPWITRRKPKALPPVGEVVHVAEVVGTVDKRTREALAGLDEDTLALALPQEELDAASELARTEHASSTLEAYATDWRLFSRYCEQRQIDPWKATPQVVATFLAWGVQKYGAKRSTIARALFGIAHHLRQVDPDNWIRGRPHHEAIRAVMRGIRRKIPYTPTQSTPLLADDVWAIMASISRNGWHNLRDRALILLAFVSASRGSEVTSLHVSDAVLEPEGIRLRIQRSKTDQEWQGIEKAIPYSVDPDGCPVRTLFEWLDAAGLQGDAPMFPALIPIGDAIQEPIRAMAAHSFDLVLRKRARDAGIDSRITSHSARAGFITEAARQGRPLDRIMRQSGHTRIDTLMRYIRPATLFEGSAASGILDGGNRTLDPPAPIPVVRQPRPAPSPVGEIPAPIPAAVEPDQPAPIHTIEHSDQRLVRLDREGLRKEREARHRAKRLREEEARTSERARSAADQARALAARGYSTDQIARAIARGLGLDVTPGDVERWLAAR